MPTPQGPQPEVRPQRAASLHVDYRSMRVRENYCSDRTTPLPDKYWRHTHYDGRSSLVSGGGSAGGPAAPQPAGSHVQRSRSASGLATNLPVPGGPGTLNNTQVELSAAATPHPRARMQQSAASSRLNSSRASPRLPATATPKPGLPAGRRITARLRDTDVIAAAAAAGATAGAAAGAAVAAAVVAARKPPSRGKVGDSSVLLRPGLEEPSVGDWDAGHDGGGIEQQPQQQPESSAWGRNSRRGFAVDMRRSKGKVWREQQRAAEEEQQQQQQQQQQLCGRHAAGPGAKRSSGAEEEGSSCSGGPADPEGGPAAAARRRSGRSMPAAGEASGREGKRQRRANEEEEGEEASGLEDDDALAEQEQWELRALPGEDTSTLAAKVRALLERAGHRVQKMHVGISMLHYAAAAGERSMDTFRVSTDSCPSYIIFPYTRPEGEPQGAPAKILAFVELESKDSPGEGDGLIRVALQWFEYWEDIIVQPLGQQDDLGDAALRNTPELFLHSIDFDTLDVDKDLGLIFDPGNFAYSIERSCTILHRDEAIEQYGSVGAYLAAVGTDAFWFQWTRTPGLLRFESAPRPGRTRTFKRLADNQDLTFMDLFAGAGGASFGYELAGARALLGIEWDPKKERRVQHAHSAYLRNFPRASTTQSLSVKEAVMLAKSGHARFPKPGEVLFIHASPPCQTLSNKNLRSCASLVKECLIDGPLRDYLDGMEYWRPISGTMEEVPQFLHANLDGQSVRPVVPVMVKLLQLGYQQDWRILSAACYGAANNRQRCWGMFAQDGYELPQPPKPRYRVTCNHQASCKVRPDESLKQALGEGCVFSLHVEGDASLPEAVTVREAIGDLPSLIGENGLLGPGGSSPFQEGGALSKFGDFMIKCQLPNRHPACDGIVLPYHERRGSSTAGAGRMLWDALAPTVCTRDDQTARTLHPVEDRFCTVAENMRLMSFPHCMHVEGSTEDKYRQVGNGVAPLQACEIMRVFYKALYGHNSPAPEIPLLKGWVEGRAPVLPQQDALPEGEEVVEEDQQQQQQEALLEDEEVVEEEQEQQQQQQRQRQCTRHQRKRLAPHQRRQQQQQQQQQAGAQSDAAAHAAATPEAEGQAAKRQRGAAAALQAAQMPAAVGQEPVYRPCTRRQQQRLLQQEPQAAQLSDPEMMDLLSDSEGEYAGVEEAARQGAHRAAGEQQKLQGWAAREAAEGALQADKGVCGPAGATAAWTGAAEAGAAREQAELPMHCQQQPDGAAMREPPQETLAEQQQLLLLPPAPPSQVPCAIKAEHGAQPQATAGSSLFVDLTGDSDKEEQAWPPAGAQQQAQGAARAARPAARFDSSMQGTQGATALAAPGLQQRADDCPAQPQAQAGQHLIVRPTPRRLVPAFTQAASPYSGNFGFPPDGSPRPEQHRPRTHNNLSPAVGSGAAAPQAAHAASWLLG